MTVTSVLLCRHGIVGYDDARAWQEEAAAAARDGVPAERLFLLQHPPVYTLGRRTRQEHLLFDRNELRQCGAEVVEVDRGGDVTFHGPGQLVGYPVLDLRRRGLLPVDYVRRLEQVLIDTLRDFDIEGERVPGRPGVWAGGGKIAAIGVRVRGGVSTHGFALNVSTDLSWFDAIVPCGLYDATVTSMAMILPAAPPLREVEESVCRAFSRVFQSELTAPGSASVAEAHARPASRVANGR